MHEDFSGTGGNKSNPIYLKHPQYLNIMNNKCPQFILFISILLIAQNTVSAQISTIEDLDAAAVFSFSMRSDSRGDSSIATGNAGAGWKEASLKCETWIADNDEFCIGVGDHAAERGANNSFMQIISNRNSFWGQHFYPNTGDHDNAAFDEGSIENPTLRRERQEAWGAGWRVLEYSGIYDRTDHVFFRQPLATPVQSNDGEHYPDQLIDYYAVREHGPFKVHILSLHFGDQSPFAKRTKDFMMSKLEEIAMTKTDYDIVVVASHANGEFVPQIQMTRYAEEPLTNMERDVLMRTADLIADGSTHISGRHIMLDSVYDNTNALWFNTGATVNTGDTYGYVTCHVLDNPPRVTMQFIDTQRQATRKLHVGPKPFAHAPRRDTPERIVPYVKEINGPFTPIWNAADWANLDVQPGIRPVVSFNTPSTDVVVPVGGSLDVSVNATDADDGVKDVKLYKDGIQLSRIDSIAPYSWGTALGDSELQNLQEGSFVLKAVAEDNGGRTNEVSISVRVADVEASPASNLILNGSFENGSTNWTLGNSASVSTDMAVEGSSVLKISGNSSPTMQTVSLPQDIDFRISFWVNTSQMAGGLLVFDTFDKFDPGTTPGGNGQMLINNGSANGWTNFTGDFNSGSESSLTIRIFGEGLAGTAYVDNIIIVPDTATGNYPPLFTSTPSTVTQDGIAYSYTFIASDYDGDALTFDVVTLPSWLSFDSLNNRISGTPTVDDINDHPVSVSVTDGVDTTIDSFTIQVSSSGNDDPVVDSIPITGVIGNVAYSYTFSASDVDGDSLNYIGTTVPSWLSFNTSNGMLSGTPSSSALGLHPVTVSVSDGTVTVDQSFNIMVFDNPAPNLVLNPSFEQGGASPSFWNKPSGNVTVSADTAASGSVALKYTGNGATFVSATIQAVAVEVNTEYRISFRANASGLSAGPLVFDTNDKPTGAEFQRVLNSANGGWTEYSGIWNSGTETSLTLRMFAETAFNGTAYFDDISVTRTVVDNVAPVFTSLPITTASEGSAYSYRMIAADAEGDNLIYSATTIPAWLSLEGATGLLSGTPGLSDVGDHLLELNVSDGQGGGDAQAFTITVDGPETAAAAVAAIIASDAGLNGDPVRNGLNDDYDGDGQSNLIEYALGGNIVGRAIKANIPSVVENSGSLNFSFRRDRADLFYYVESSNDLMNWVVDGRLPATDTASDEALSIAIDGSKTFVRLRVSDISD